MDSVKQPKHVDIEHLPDSGTTLFGREDDLDFLTKTWDERETRILCLVAQGGVGKSALVLRWLEGIKAEGYRGADRIYGWSFYSQGVGERRVISAEVFVNKALREWFGDTRMAGSSRSSWEKGERLGQYLQQERILLILDGLEPLQSPLASDRGRVRDLAVASLFRQLISANPGLCVVTTREEVKDLQDYVPLAKNRDLEQISAKTGKEILRHHGVKGKDEELEQLSRHFGNHALTVTLLGAYLFGTVGRHVENAEGITAFVAPHGTEKIEPAEQRARQVIAALTAQFGKKMYVNVLHLLGLFDRPVTADDLEVLRVKNKIVGLTDAIHDLSASDWNLVLDHLRRARLLLPRNHCNEGGIDAHPIVRAHFRAELEGRPEVWCEANGILYAHYSSLPKEHRPDNLEHMEPLYRAIDHGCCAGKYQETLDNILIDRLRRGDEHYSFFRGYLGQEMTALSRFFKRPWTELADDRNLSPVSQAWLFNEAGSVLRVTGNLSEAVAPILRSIRLLEENGECMRASRSVATLVNVYRLMGRLDEALEWAERAVNLVDQSDSVRERIAKYSLLASVHHIRGEIGEAEEWIDKAGKLQAKAVEADRLQTGHYEVLRCSMLARQGKWQEIRLIMESVLRWLPTTNERSQALILSTLGRALYELAQCGGATLREAREKLDAGVDRMRETGRQDELPRVLLSRAECLLRDNDSEDAKRDIDEAYEIAVRLGMRLHEAEAHLAYARLHLFSEPKDSEAAVTHLAKAEQIATNTGYRRRFDEIAELWRFSRSRGTGSVAIRGQSDAREQLTAESSAGRGPMFERANVGILTVIPSEGGAVLARFRSFPSYRSAHERRIYHGIEVVTESGQAHRVVMTNAIDQGQAQIVPTCYDLMNRFDPELIILVGVGGAIHKSIRLCDVCIADEIISYTKAKERPEGVAHRGSTYQMSGWLRILINEFFCANGGPPARLFQNKNAFLVHLCPFGTGNWVIVNPLSEVRMWLRTVNDKTGVVETEGEGLSEVERQSELSPKRWALRGTMVVRGISDHADENKSDDLQPIAVANAIEAVISFLRFVPSFVSDT